MRGWGSSRKPVPAPERRAALNGTSRAALLLLKKPLRQEVAEGSEAVSPGYPHGA